MFEIDDEIMFDDNINFHDLVPDESLNVEINGCGICSDINHCINTWNLYCNKNITY